MLQPTERIKKRILSQAEKTGYVDATAIFIDSTHIKASANRNKSKEVKVTKPIKQYQLELEAEINSLRLADGKKKLLPSSMKGVLPTVHKQLATDTALFWILKWEQETYTTGSYSTNFTRKWN